MQPTGLIEANFRLSPPQKSALKKLGLRTILDLLYHFPTRYGDTSEMKSIAGLKQGETAVIFGKISGLKTSKGFHTKIPMADGVIEDDTGKIKAVWFNQPYLAKMIAEGAFVRAEGKVSARKKNGELYLSNPKIEKVEKLPIGVGDSLFGEAGVAHTLYPVYPESRGITSNWFYHAIQKVFKSGILDNLFAYSRELENSSRPKYTNEESDPIPKEILEKYHLPTLKTALVWIHAPLNQNDALSARKRFAFEEVFFIQLARQLEKKKWQEHSAFVINKTDEEITKFTSRFPFEATEAQKKAISQVLNDFKVGKAMSRLLEGDVGSGKTAVAATTAYAVITSGKNFHSSAFASVPQNSASVPHVFQVAYMCPTEILATQHFESFIQYFKHLPIQIGLITSSGCQKFPSKLNPAGWTDISRAQLLKWAQNGEIAVLIGTHSLISKSVKFKNLAYAIIDEQHRFGVSQRMALASGKARNARETNAEIVPGNTLIYKDLSYIIRNVLFDVKKTLGSGHKEIIYQRAIEEELRHRKITYSREKQIPIIYRGKKIGTYQPDFVIDNKIILELKTLPFLGAREKKQLWGYLKSSPYKLGFLANYGPAELVIERVIFDTARSNSSASVPQSSAFVPHFLSMTATPIPRTLALTIYGDLDLSLLDEMPHGRKPIITEIVLQNKREKTYENVRAELKAGRQVYVICPRIDEPDPAKEMAILAKSVKEEAKRLKKSIFSEYEIAILHSKMKSDEKDEVMLAFKRHKIDILVATSVVEVGVNVENATTIIIEGAERFGLAQLHQLRGRVIRSNHQAYCYVFAETKTQKTIDRLKAFQTAKNGFELAEYDLQFRGAGELSGFKQWGITDIGMEALKNLKMVEAARFEATQLIEKDSTLKNYPLIIECIKKSETKIHFE